MMITLTPTMNNKESYDVRLIDSSSSTEIDSCNIFSENSHKLLYKSALKKLELEEDLSEYYTESYGNRHVLKNKYQMYLIVIEKN